MNLYWVETDDHHEDWFILAESEKRAELIHEEFEGYDDGDAKAQFVTKVPEEFVTEPGHPSIEVLVACGAKIIRAETPRLVEIDGKRFVEGMMQHQILSIDDDKFEAKGMGRPNRTKRLKKS